ncbi:glutamate synthase subunit beta [Planctomycetes bacterium Pla163]|uniref:Glutamate synthase subunit beta n=1 Tax=Rohdeia mirabilis TaxID=2528008 RepID=A0A518CW26_9BACT|nr:glutamate synthase subunit beta [Planctomycetes bacterium Pla163]
MPPQDVQIHLAPGAFADPVLDRAAVLDAVCARIDVRPDRIAHVQPLKLSFDARPRQRRWQLATRVWLVGEERDVPAAPVPPALERPAQGAARVVVVGAGPAGMFGALELAAAGFAVTLLDRGGDVQQRRRPLARANRGQGIDPNSNYCFGEGGAGTYSDGKLYTRSGDKREVRAILQLLVAHGARADIAYQWRPHIGSNKLPEVVKALRETLVSGGVDVRYQTRATRIECTDGERGARSVRAVHTVSTAEDSNDGTERLECDAVVLATGHSAPDALAMAVEAGARLVPKGFAMGVRGEHPQPWLDRHQYGGLAETCELPAAFYELVQQADGRGVYSFCMCPGGWIVPASTADDRLVVNGMSLSRRDSPHANSGLVVAIEPEDWCGARAERWGWRERLPELPPAPDEPADDPLYGVRLQEALERRAAVVGGGHGRAPAQRVDQFVDGVASSDTLPTSYVPGLQPTDLREVLPRGMALRLRYGLIGFDHRMPGFVSEIGQLVGVESRTSSPVRIPRDDETLMSPDVVGLFPAGEGAGYAGGIVSAAIDGRRVARAVAQRFASRPS